jgi:hypothetical protein
MVLPVGETGRAGAPGAPAGALGAPVARPVGAGATGRVPGGAGRVPGAPGLPARAAGGAAAGRTSATGRSSCSRPLVLEMTRCSGSAALDSSTSGTAAGAGAGAGAAGAGAAAAAAGATGSGAGAAGSITGVAGSTTGRSATGSTTGGSATIVGAGAGALAGSAGAGVVAVAAFFDVRLAGLGSSGWTSRTSPSLTARRRTRSAWASSMLEEWLFTPMPSAIERSRASLFVRPSSLASSWTRIFPATCAVCPSSVACHHRATARRRTSLSGFPGAFRTARPARPRPRPCRRAPGTLGRTPHGARPDPGTPAARHRATHPDQGRSG